MTWLAVALSIALFCWSLHAFRLVPASLEAISTARRAAGVMRDPALDDDQKEGLIRAAALRLFGLFATITVRALLALLAPVAVVVLLAWLGLVELDAVIAASLSWPVILGSLILMAVALVFWR